MEVFKYLIYSVCWLVCEQSHTKTSCMEFKYIWWEEEELAKEEPLILLIRIIGRIKECHKVDKFLMTKRSKETGFWTGNVLQVNQFWNRNWCRTHLHAHHSESI